MNKTAMLTVKRGSKPMHAAVVAYNFGTGRMGKVIVSEPIPDNFSNDDLISAARRLVPLAEGYEVVLPTGVNL